MNIREPFPATQIRVHDSELNRTSRHVHQGSHIHSGTYRLNLPVTPSARKRTLNDCRAERGDDCGAVMESLYRVSGRRKAIGESARHKSGSWQRILSTSTPRRQRWLDPTDGVRPSAGVHQDLPLLGIENQKKGTNTNGVERRPVWPVPVLFWSDVDTGVALSARSMATEGEMRPLAPLLLPNVDALMQDECPTPMSTLRTLISPSGWRLPRGVPLAHVPPPRTFLKPFMVQDSHATSMLLQWNPSFPGSG